MKRTPFEILGVGQYTTQKEIRRRYLDLIKKHHPDINKTTSVDIREITVAYESLTNKHSTTAINWEQVKQKNIDTQRWTRNSYFVGFSLASLLIIYLTNGNNKKEYTTLLPHEKAVIKKAKEQTPWQEAGLSFREWRKNN